MTFSVAHVHHAKRSTNYMLFCKYTSQRKWGRQQTKQSSLLTFFFYIIKSNFHVYAPKDILTNIYISEIISRYIQTIILKFLAELKVDSS